MGHGEAQDSLLAEGLTCAINSCHMGMTAEEIATQYGISRGDQDAFAAASQQRAERALKDGSFKKGRLSDFREPGSVERKEITPA